MSNLKNVIYLSNEDYETLVSTGSVTISGTTLTYDENNLYITPDKLATSTEDGLMSAADKSKIDGLATVALSGSYNDLTNKPSIPSDSSLVHKTGDERISGEKTFTNENGLTTWFSLNVKNTNTNEVLRIIENQLEGATGFNIQLGSNPIITIANNGAYISKDLKPYSNNQTDLGSSLQKWKDLYLAGNVVAAVEGQDQTLSASELVRKVNLLDVENDPLNGYVLKVDGHIKVYGDVDDQDSKKPDNHVNDIDQSSDIDTVFYNTGFYIEDNSPEDTKSYKISFPGKTGTFALVEDLDDCVTYEEALEILAGSAEIEGSSLVLPASAEIEGTTVTTSGSMTIDGSTLII